VVSKFLHDIHWINHRFKSSLDKTTRNKKICVDTYIKPKAKTLFFLDGLMYYILFGVFQFIEIN